jgi:hypothetical protein
MLGSIAFTIYDHQWFPDIFFILPFIAIMSGWTFHIFIKDISNLTRSFRLITSYVASGLCSIWLLTLIINGTLRFKAPFTFSDQYQLAETVGEFLENNETIYAIGCTHLLAFNHAENWTIYGFFFRGVSDFIAHKTGENIFK